MKYLTDEYFLFKQADQSPRIERKTNFNFKIEWTEKKKNKENILKRLNDPF